MIKHYESYAYIDLSALRDDKAGDDAEPLDAGESCAGKVLLMFTGRGMELVRVPAVLN
jgi:hypothetical protein